MTNKYLSFVLLFSLTMISATKIFAQAWPRIYKQHDTLYTDPAPAYQWYKNGVKIPNAVQNWFRPDTSGELFRCRQRDVRAEKRYLNLPICE